MNTVVHHRCFNHPPREAAALCPQCNRPYCRECVTEHEERILCASCLKIILSSSPLRSRSLFLSDIAGFMAGFALLWFFYYYLARILLAIPSSFHEGTVWKGMMRLFE
jgi:hypothetical protein